MFGKKYAGHNDFKIALTRQLVFFIRFKFSQVLFFTCYFVSEFCELLLR